MHQNGAVRIALGDTYIGIRSRDREFIDTLCVDYDPFLVKQPPDFWIELTLRRTLSASEINEFLEELRFCPGDDGFITKPRLVDCHVNWESGLVSIETERELFTSNASFKLMNHLLRGLYYSIYKLRRGIRPDAYLIHGCGIVSDGRGYLFVGPSGVGKTTIATLAGGSKVLNDEPVLVGQNSSGFYLSGTPFDGGVSNRSPTVERLSAVFSLKQAHKVALRKLGGAEAYRMFLGQVLDVSPLLDNSKMGSVSERADLSAAVAAGVPVYELSFLPDTSFWEEVNAIPRKD